VYVFISGFIATGLTNWGNCCKDLFVLI